MATLNKGWSKCKPNDSAGRVSPGRFRPFPGSDDDGESGGVRRPHLVQHRQRNSPQSESTSKAPLNAPLEKTAIKIRKVETRAGRDGCSLTLRYSTNSQAPAGAGNAMRSKVPTFGIVIRCIGTVPRLRWRFAPVGLAEGVLWKRRRFQEASN